MDPERQKSKAIQKVKASPLSTFETADIILQGLTGKDVDLDKLEKLLEIKGKYEAEENKKIFQVKFAEMQAELPIIKKTNTVKDNSGNTAYKYAPLEKIIEQIKDVLKKHKFSYRWTETASDKENHRKVNCHIMGWGHEQITSIDIPIPDVNKLTNKTQMAGSAMTYGKRYSLIGALGIIADEDDDGRGAGSVPEKKQAKPRAKKIEQHPELVTKIKQNCEILWGDKKAFILCKEYIKKKYGCRFIDLDNTKLEELAKYFRLCVDRQLSRGKVSYPGKDGERLD